MRTAVWAALAMAATGALGVGASQAAGAPQPAKPKGTKIACKVHLQEQDGTTATKGEDFGTITCTKRFGEGVQHDTYTFAFSSPTAGTGTLKFKDYYDKGTVSGIWNLKAVVVGTTIDYTFTVKLESGTGAYKGVKGSGKGIGTQAATANTADFTYSATVTR
jgi:hypothetical protein